MAWLSFSRTTRALCTGSTNTCLSIAVALPRSRRFLRRGCLSRSRHESLYHVIKAVQGPKSKVQSLPNAERGMRNADPPSPRLWRAGGENGTAFNAEDAEACPERAEQVEGTQRGEGGKKVQNAECRMQNREPGNRSPETGKRGNSHSETHGINAECGPKGYYEGTGTPRGSNGKQGPIPMRNAECGTRTRRRRGYGGQAAKTAQPSTQRSKSTQRGDWGE